MTLPHPPLLHILSFENRVCEFFASKTWRRRAGFATSRGNVRAKFVTRSGLDVVLTSIRLGDLKIKTWISIVPKFRPVSRDLVWRQEDFKCGANSRWERCGAKSRWDSCLSSHSSERPCLLGVLSPYWRYKFSNFDHGRRHICLLFDHGRRHLNLSAKKSCTFAENGVLGFLKAPWILMGICARVAPAAFTRTCISKVRVI